MSILIVLIPMWVVFAGVVSLIAHAAGRRPGVWFLGGLFMGPVAMAYLVFAPEAKRPFQPLAWPPDQPLTNRFRGAVKQPFTVELLYREPDGQETFHSATVLGHDATCDATGRCTIECIHTFCAAGRADRSFATAGILELAVNGTGEVLHPPAVQQWLTAKLLNSV